MLICNLIWWRKKWIRAYFRSQAQFRKDTIAEITPDVLARYEDLRLKKKGIALGSAGLVAWSPTH